MSGSGSSGSLSLSNGSTSRINGADARNRTHKRGVTPLDRVATEKEAPEAELQFDLDLAVAFWWECFQTVSIAHLSVTKQNLLCRCPSNNKQRCKCTL